MDKFQGQVRRNYLAILRRKDKVHFGTGEGSRGAIETIFRQVVFKPLVFGTLREMSSNARELIEMAVKYGVEHMGMNMATTTVVIAGSTFRRRYKTHLSLAT